MTVRRLALVAAVPVALAGAVGAWVLANGRGSTPSEALEAPRFVDEAGPSGVDHTYDGDSPFFVGGGVATLDCDGDAFPDLYLAGGANPAALYRNDSEVGGTLRFEHLTDAVTDLTGVTGAYPLDLDGDGLTDLAVLRVGENVLLRGLGDCRFERANERWGFDGGEARTMAFAATWEGHATLPTLAIGDYIPLTEHGTPVPPCPDNRLLRPTADGTTYGEPIPLTPGYCPLSMLFSDWDRSGRRDLRVSNDRQYYTDGEEQLWRIEPGADPVAYTAADGWTRLQVWGMGIASQDLTGDGYPEVYLTSQGDNKLQTLMAGPDAPTYRDIAYAAGVHAPRPFTGGDAGGSTAWHPEFVDVNADGFLDLYVTKGNVSQQVGYAMRDPSELFLGQPDGTFRQATEDAGLLRFDRGRGATLADLNLDGLPDLVEVYLSEPVGVWRNVGGGTTDAPQPMGHWLELRLSQGGRNRDAVGAWVEVRIGEATILHEVTVGGGHISGDAGWIHVGLGPSERAEVRVTWPDGTVGPWQQVAADDLVIVARDADQPRVVTPGREDSSGDG
ncbi:MAG TPA: CRTAC1 family protein [Candidatus Limnocylindria bacterium]|nr:CRTAC1 family protein [Candidatus Limnocylindria bacterium]